MKQLYKYILFLGIAIIFSSCSSPEYIFSADSYKRQQELREMRKGRVIEEVLTGSASFASFVFFGDGIVWQPSEQEFKKLNLLNPTTDTVYVNMLTDIFWDKNNYCDFMDIRIPPKENCRILVPVDADYNVYFSNTPRKDDDELLQVNTSKTEQIILKPGMNLISKSN